MASASCAKLQDAQQLLAEEAHDASDFSRRMLQALALCEGSHSQHVAQLPEPDPMGLDIFPTSSSSGSAVCHWLTAAHSGPTLGIYGQLQTISCLHESRMTANEQHMIVV